MNSGFGGMDRDSKEAVAEMYLVQELCPDSSNYVTANQMLRKPFGSFVQILHYEGKGGLQKGSCSVLISSPTLCGIYTENSRNRPRLH